MADVTFADALAALRAECGEATREVFGDVDGRAFGEVTWLAPYRVGVELSDFDGPLTLLMWRGVVTRGGECVHLTLAGTPTADAPLTPLTPLADAVRDAGAWLRATEPLAR